MIEYVDEEGLISPEDIESDVNTLGADTAVTAFSDFLFRELIDGNNAVEIGRVTGGVDRTVFAVERDGKRVLVYQSPIGAPAAAAVMEEIGALGVKNFVAFGICGALVDTPFRTMIVPDRAYRDEGTSYHYLPAADYVELKNAQRVRKTLADLGINTLVGGAWTTDGFYREARTRAELMRARGCVAVDMESAALQAVCDFRGYNFHTFFITADSLAGEKWQGNDITKLAVTSADEAAVAAAVELAFALANGKEGA